MPKLLTKWQSLFGQRQIPTQTMAEYMDVYITDRLFPMWPPGWITSSEIYSHFPTASGAHKAGEKRKFHSVEEPTKKRKLEPVRILLPI